MQIVFDTNAYRCLVEGKSLDEVKRDFAAVTGAEERRGFQVFMAPVPWMELFCHLVDTSDRAFETCVKAVVGSFIHSRLDFRTGRGKLMPQYEMLISHALFQYQDERATKTLYALDDLAAAINRAPSQATVKINLPILQSIRNFSNQMKDNFVKTFQQYQQQFHAFSDSRKKSLRKEFNFDVNYIAWLNATLAHAALAANVSLDGLDLDAKLEKMRLIVKLYPAPGLLMKEIMSKMIGNQDFNIESKRRKNWYWDYQMLFYISGEHPLVLVTDDGPMIDAAIEAGVGSRVLGLKEYIGMLELNIKTG